MLFQLKKKKRISLFIISMMMAIWLPLETWKETSILKNGTFIELNEDGGISQKGTYVNDKIEGEWLILWPNGEVKQRLSFHEGLLDGPCYTYFPNGAKSGFYPMKAGHKNGKVRGIYCIREPGFCECIYG